MGKIKLSKGAIKLTKVEQIQAEIDNKNAAIEQEAANGQQTNHEQIIQWRNEISILEMQLSDEKALEANQQRVDEAKTVAVTNASLIGLDSDVSELIGIYVSEAVLKEQAKHDEHTQQLTEAHKGKLDNLTGQAVETENQLAAERNVTAQLQEQVNSLQTANSQLLIDKQDADNKRDAAVREKEAETSRVNHLSNLVDDANAEIKRLNEHVDDLRVKLANAPAPKAAIDITPNERAQELIAKIQLKNVQYADFKRSTLQGEDAHGNIVSVNYLDAAKIEHVTEFPSIPAIPAITEQVEQFPDHQENTNHDVHSGGTQATEGNQTVHELVQPAAEENLSEPIPHDEMLAKLYQAHNELKLSHADLTARVDRIEVHANIPKVA